VTRAQHRRRGTDLIAAAEHAADNDLYDRAAAYAAMATAHLTAAQRHPAPAARPGD
jgi:hypothetical protein